MIRNRATASHRKSEVRGCCDLGSSYFRLLVVEGVFPQADGFERGTLDGRAMLDERRYAGWGADLAETGEIGAPGLSRAIEALAELLRISRGARCPAPALVATNTLREAANAAAAARAIERSAGLPIRVLSQREEAELGFAGAAFFHGGCGALCLVDIGGTSTEVSWGRGMSMEDFAGFPAGVHRVHAALGGNSTEGSSASRIADILERYDASRPAPGAGVYRLPPLAEGTTMLVTGGTAVSLAAARRLMRDLAPGFDEPEPMTLEDLASVRLWLAETLRSKGEEGLPFDAPRARLLPAGVMLAESLLRAFGAKEFAVTARDLRWGVVLEREGGKG